MSIDRDAPGLRPDACPGDVTLTLTLHLQAESFTGSATADRGYRRAFAGWLGLVAALDSIIRDAGVELGRPAGDKPHVRSNGGVTFPAPPGAIAPGGAGH